MAEIEKSTSRWRNFMNRVYDPGKGYTDETLSRNRDLADFMLQQNANTTVQSPTQGLAMLMRALNAKTYNERADRGERALKEQKARELAEFLGNFDPNTQSLIGNAPESIRGQLAGQAALQQMTPPKPPKYSSKTIRNGANYETRRIINGQVDMTEEGLLSTSPIDRVQQTETYNRDSPFETSGNRDQETLRKRAVLGVTGELAESLRNVQANPRSTGMVGATADAANAFGDVPVVGKFITTLTEEMTNLSPQELSEIRTQSESMVAKLVPVITGDVSGRYTDREQERTRDIQAQSKFWKTGDQVLGGLGELQAIQIRGEIRTTGAQAIELFAGQPLDLSTDEGVDQWGELLMTQYGLPFEKAVNEVRKHLNLLGL